MQHVCPNRIWNIALAQNSNYSKLLWVLDPLSRGPYSAHSSKKHAECTEQMCVVAHDDTTNKRQLHKCPGGNCAPFVFPVEELDMLYRTLQHPVD